MMPLPENEAERLAALADYAILDSPPEGEYDDLVRLASLLCDAPMALVTFVDRERQWFKARIGLDASETPRENSFCAHAILDDVAFVVPDAREDARFRENPLVEGDVQLRFYAGVPLTDPAGLNLGSLCVLDTKPRRLTATQLEALAALARQVVSLLVSRRRLRDLEAARRDAKFENARFSAFIDAGPALAFMKDDEGRYVFVNDAMVRRSRVPRERWIGRTDEEIFPPLAASLRTQDRAVLQSGRIQSFEEAVPSPDGTCTYWATHKFPIESARGERLVGGISLDVTERRHAEMKLAESEARFRETLDRLAEGVLVSDVETRRLLDANAAFCALLGYSRERIADRTLSDLGLCASHEAFAAQVASDLEPTKGKSYDAGRGTLRHADGSDVPVDVRITRVPNGRAGLYATIVRDIRVDLAREAALLQKHEALEEANAKLRVLSVTDGMTGMQNWTALQRSLATEVDRAARYGRPLAFVILDIDAFKAYNDTFGHPAGDEVIRRVADVIKTTVRATDMVARYGGEEFAVVLPDTDAAGALELAERLRARVAECVWPLRPVTVSVGVASRAATMANAAALVAAADGALYQSKRAGRDRVTFASSKGEGA